MVRFKNLVWSPETHRRRLASNEKKQSSKLGILAFETAKIMSRLVSLYESLSDEGISTLKNDVVRSKGVQFLNSGDEDFLLSLACAEKLEDLDRAANAVSWLGKRCDDFGLNRFVLTYTDLKLGIYDFGKSELLYGSRASEKKVRGMEKLVSSTSSLHAALDALTEMEISERKLKQLSYRQIETMKINIDEFIDKLENQRKEVRHFREISLWSKTFDKSVDLMARIVCVVYLRICSVFGPQTHENLVSHSGPLLTQSNPAMVRFYSQRSIHFPDEDEGTKIAKTNNTLFNSAGPDTVGGSGLAMRYANLIILAEKYLDLDSNVAVSHEDRELFYQMVPENVRAVLRTKLSKKVKCAEKDACLAEGWRDAMAEIMGWLAPMAQDSLNWQMERSQERIRIDAKPNSVLLLQTLHFSDKEKTEAAIAEVLVGLSCIFRFENRQLSV